MPGTWGLTLALCGTLVSLIVGLQLGPAASVATVFALIMEWIYSAPPLRLKNPSKPVDPNDPRQLSPRRSPSALASVEDLTRRAAAMALNLEG